MSAAEGRGSGTRGRAVQQAPGLWRTDLQRQDLSVSGREVVQSRAAIGPEAPLVRHTHAGEQIIYVLEGSLEHQIEGQPL
jgi:quercetin dioxygenase-like cupin family protein